MPGQPKLPRHHSTHLNLVDFQLPGGLLDYGLTEIDLEPAIFLLGTYGVVLFNINIRVNGKACLTQVRKTQKWIRLYGTCNNSNQDVTQNLPGAEVVFRGQGDDCHVAFMTNNMHTLDIYLHVGQPT